MTRRIALVIEYDGTNFSGFQRQKNASSVQGEIENAIESLTRRETILRGAGRTDAGVHATGQVAAFDTESVLPIPQIVSGLNNYLCEDIAIKSAYEVSGLFDPRRDALSRVYRYRLLESEHRSPFRKDFAQLVRIGLNTNKMQSAAATLLGTHDFRAFSGSQPAGKSYTRLLSRIDIWRNNDEIAVEFEGNAFLPQQIRRTVAALVDVGYSKTTIEKFEQMLTSGIQGAAQKVFPARGLTLREVKYTGLPWRENAITTNN
ncbi:MAG: tRNA pseudouridine(38-40) synthase TruA [Dehalococcoidia bacterium]|nr:tRNA pseudouridine(38-40) synthase TruA [Dehalococcoidia bacterium]